MRTKSRYRNSDLLIHLFTQQLLELNSRIYKKSIMMQTQSSI